PPLGTSVAPDPLLPAGAGLPQRASGGDPPQPAGFPPAAGLLKVVPTARLRSFRAAGAQQPFPTKPREPPLASRTALVHYPATCGFVVGACAGIPPWRERG